MKKILVLIFAALLGAGTAGCASLQSVAESSESRVAVMYGTAKYINGDNEKRERVVAVANEIRAHLGSELVTVAALDAEIRRQIQWHKLDGADHMLLEELLTALRTSLEKRIGEGVLSPESRVVVNTVVDWVISGSRF